MLKIRLQRTGRRNLPAYSVVVTESTAPVKGKFLEKVGYYSPLSKGCKLDLERIAYWQKVGAKPSETVQDLISKNGEVKKKTRTRLGKRQKARIEADKKAAEAKLLEEKKAPAEKEQTEDTPEVQAA